MKEETFQERLRKLCLEFDETYGDYPEHLHEGRALYHFYLQRKK